MTEGSQLPAAELEARPGRLAVLLDPVFTPVGVYACPYLLCDRGRSLGPILSPARAQGALLVRGVWPEGHVAGKAAGQGPATNAARPAPARARGQARFPASGQPRLRKDACGQRPETSRFYEPGQ